jgi:uncharacterized protein (TIGR03000 family)
MMYGVVLLMAVTAGGESADLGRRNKGCCGCSGYVASCRGYSCSGCYGGGGYGGYAGCGGGYGGGVPSYGCGGGVPSYGGGVPSYGCGGGVPHVPHAGHGKHVSAASPNAATVVVTLPENAKLTIDGDATTSTSSVRTFETPELVAGKTYSYTLEATFQQDGKPVVVSKKVQIEAGKTASVDLNPTPATGVARN